MTYQEFLNAGIDLSPLGVEKGENCRYFCTPKGARIIGSLGVDGIHFCLIEGFGESVFAVSPMNGVGEYVHPVARNFGDFLSLLLSCGGSAIEQAWQWNKEQFYAFLQENPPAREQGRAMERVARELSVPFMEEPFEYVKKLQEEFDYSKIKFSAEYDDVVCPAPKREPAWKVYYDGGFWKGCGHAGEERALDKKFAWGDEKWRIPALYLCGNGFVVDYCIEIAPEKVKIFLDKWESAIFSEREMRPEVRRQMERENPLEAEFRARCTLNGREIGQNCGSAIHYLPPSCLPSGAENSEEALALMKHYHLDSTKAWAFHRRSYPWATARKPKTINSLSVRLERLPERIEGISFRNPSVGDEISFIHPVSGVEHKLTVIKYERQEFPRRAFLPGLEIPTHCTVMTYTLTPPLPKDSFLLSDRLENDEPRRIENGQKGEPSADVGVIGGADGPTAVFLFPKEGKGEECIAFSSLHFEPISEVEWKIEFFEKTKEDKQISLIKGTRE